MSVVIDASAVLAIVFEEPGADIALRAARGAFLSAVNLDEILHKAARRGLAERLVEDQIERLRMIVQPFDAVQARASADLHPRVHKRDISFADRACLALAIVTQRPVLTGEQKWPSLGLDIDIRLIR